MRTTNLKRIAVAGAFTGALSLAAVGLGAGAANADEGDIPFVPGGLDDVQSVLPLIETLGGIGDLGGVGDLGSLTDLGNLAQPRRPRQSRRWRPGRSPRTCRRVLRDASQVNHQEWPRPTSARHHAHVAGRWRMCCGPDPLRAFMSAAIDSPVAADADSQIAQRIRPALIGHYLIRCLVRDSHTRHRRPVRRSPRAGVGDFAPNSRRGATAR